MQGLLGHAPSPIEEISEPVLRRAGVRLLIKRDDLLFLPAYRGDRAFCGNKWRKLKYNLTAAKDAGYQTLLSFGGAYSNHIAALASAGALFGLRTVGVIRGGERVANPTLRHARKCGMVLHFMDRSSYREKERPEVTDILRRSYGDPYIIPEGGTNQHALRGCRELAEEILAQTAGSELPDAFGVACGTGGTLAGLTDGFGNSVKGLGISVLKGGFHQNTVGELLEKYAEKPPRNWEIRSGFHFGGYARFTPALIDFINRFKSRHRIPLDPVYTGKLLFAIFHLVENGYFPENSTVLVIHTGGLQGVAGFNERFPDWPIH